jgi:hypothetical protein
MKKILIAIGALISFNAYAEPINPLREKLYGRWSADCADPKWGRTIRTSSLLGGDKYEVINSKGEVTITGTYKVESITANKFRIHSSFMPAKEKIPSTGILIGEFPENGSFSKYIVTNSKVTNSKGEIFSIERRGGFVYRKLFTETEAKLSDDNLMVEKCLN